MVLKVEDLQVGDLVAVKRSGKVYFVHIKNIGLSSIFYDGKEVGEDGIIECSIKKVQRVLLTQERVKGIDNVSMYDDGTVVIYGKNSFSGELRYMHELQQMMRLCGLF